MAPTPNPRLLSWTDVDPARHPFDPDEAYGVVRSLEPAARAPDGQGSRDVAERWTSELTAALVERYGPWAAGWSWTTSEPGGGGPVHGWCCAQHSIGAPEETLERIADCLVEWREWLEDLAERFARFPIRATPPPDRELMWERAAVHLVTQVLDRTFAEDAWYGTAETVLRWYLTGEGVAERDADRLVRRAIGGRFESWITPAPGAIADVGERLAADLSRLDGDA
ncbi:hypothetical protein [Actinomadura kijaniata]|uniref:hypothetical protein n=1 Tax=Actinomadura kijaniata TaxID=46161 RepID=UPI00082AFB72|nr:hypothetical protein [Actinomadura kijaniata]